MAYSYAAHGSQNKTMEDNQGNGSDFKKKGFNLSTKAQT